jgi:hypothetical protein
MDGVGELILPHPRPFPRQQGKGEKSLSVYGEGFREGFQSLILSSPTVAHELALTVWNGNRVYFRGSTVMAMSLPSP